MHTNLSQRMLGGMKKILSKDDTIVSTDAPVLAPAPVPRDCSLITDPVERKKCEEAQAKTAKESLSVFQFMKAKKKDRKPKGRRSSTYGSVWGKGPEGEEE